jgi:nitrite reductase (NADH) large subunit
MRYVIIGTSAAGLAAAEVVRARDPQGGISLISEEEHLPYSRPLLTYLLGREIQPEKIFLKTADYFAAWGFTPFLGKPVVQVDPEAHTVTLAGGEALPFDRLLIASGARPRRPDIPGLDLQGVHTLRNLVDVERLEADLPGDGGEVVVVGAGAVGLKMADALVTRGLRVRLLARGAQPLSRILDRVSADLLMAVVKEKGIDLHLHSWPEAVFGEKRPGDRGGPEQQPGTRRPRRCCFRWGWSPGWNFWPGLTWRRADGIRVDSFMRSQAPDIFAAGDCCVPKHLLTDQHTSFHIWPAAVAQGQVAGANMAGGRRRYDGILPMNSISLKGFRIITGGHFTPDTADGEIFTDLDRHRRRYRRLVFQAGRLVGVTLVGEVEQAGIYFQIMSQKLPVSALPVDLHSGEFHPGKLVGLR